MVNRDIGSEAPQLGVAFTEGRRIVAAVGIDRYRTWPRLGNAVNDARGAVEIFQRLGFEQIVAPLIDEMATADAIRRLVSDDLAAIGRDDSLVLFIAGHGHTHTRTLPTGPVQTGFFIPVDGDAPGGRTANWLRLDTWLSDVARLPARHILVILDACHGGIVLGSLIKWRGDATGSLTELRRRQSRRVITSALGDQRAMDGGPVGGHSLFTGCLIEGLTGGLARDGRVEVTGSELGVYLQQRVGSYAGSLQTPDFGTLELDDRGELVVPVATGWRPPHAPATEPARQVDPAVPPRGEIDRWWLGVGLVAVGILLQWWTAKVGAAAAIVVAVFVLVLVLGRISPRAPSLLRAYSTEILRRKRWLVAMSAALVLGFAAGMGARMRLDRECSQALSAAADLPPASDARTSAAVMDAMNACTAVGREEEVARTRRAAAGARVSTAAHAVANPEADPPALVEVPREPGAADEADAGSPMDANRAEPPAPAPTTPNASSALPVDATRLWTDYEVNEVSADRIYRGKLLQVSGTISSIDKDFMSEIVLRLKSPHLFLSTMATLRTTDAGKVAALRKGARVTLICRGGGRVIGAPVLSDCRLKG